MMRSESSSRFVVLVLVALLLLCAPHSARAVPRMCPGCGMVGLARGQVLRINAAHIGDPNQQPIQIEMELVDADGGVVARDSQTIEPGHAVHFDVPFEDVGGAEGRVELRPVVSGGPQPHLRLSLEVFDADTGKTTVYIGDPGI